MSDLTDDQKERLREAARLANVAVSNGAIDDLDDNDVVVIEPVITALPALLDENDRLKADIAEAAQVRWEAAQQIDRLRDAVGRITRERDEWEGNEQAQHRALSTLTETVRDVATSLRLQENIPAPAVALAARTLHTACDQAEKG